MKNIYSLFCVIAVGISPIFAQIDQDIGSTDFARNTTPNVLNMHIAGGDYAYEDNLYIYFWEGATTGYDIELESIKWYSINDDATMIWSIAEDGTELAINAMPLSCLYDGMTSIPIHFQCGYDNEYTLTFGGMDGFEFPTEFWLEDKSTEDEWFSVNRDNDTYTFQGSVSDSSINRFVMHFLDPTGIEENIPEIDPENKVTIYAANNYAYIQNNTNEFIREIQVFDLVGNEILRNKNISGILNKYYISGHTGYYFIKVITTTNIYSRKIFIGQ
jgi:hypothetical protein